MGTCTTHLHSGNSLPPKSKSLKKHQHERSHSVKLEWMHVGIDVELAELTYSFCDASCQPVSNIISK